MSHTDIVSRDAPSTDSVVRKCPLVGFVLVVGWNCLVTDCLLYIHQYNWAATNKSTSLTCHIYRLLIPFAVQTCRYPNRSKNCNISKSSSRWLISKFRLQPSSESCWTSRQPVAAHRDVLQSEKTAETLSGSQRLPVCLLRDPTSASRPRNKG